ncbi:MAG TPA: ATP-binding protein [Burkholderiaceae bacterium]
MRGAVRRIAVIGAECVGKTTLCEQLARELRGDWIAEYLREFCAARGRTPAESEQAHILQVQIEREAQAEAAAAARGLGWLLCDSAPIVTATYSVQYFGDRSLLDAAIAHHRRYDATLLLAPDLPWQADGIQRDGAGVRERFHALLAGRLSAAGISTHLTEGQGAARLASARAVLLRL